MQACQTRIPSSSRSRAPHGVLLASAKQTLTLRGPHKSRPAPRGLRTCILQYFLRPRAPEASRTRGPLGSPGTAPPQPAKPLFIETCLEISLGAAKSRPRVFFRLKPVLKFFQEPKGADQEFFFRPRRPPRALQERKRGLRRPTRTEHEISRKHCKIQVRRPLGLPFGTLLAPKMAETCLGISLGAPKSHPRVFFG